MICYQRYGSTIIATFKSNSMDNKLYIGFSMYRKINKELAKVPFIANEDTGELMDFIFRILQNRQDSLCGVSKCHPNDEFDLEVGKKLAKKRLLNNYYHIQDEIFYVVYYRISYQLNKAFVNCK